MGTWKSKELFNAFINTYPAPYNFPINTTPYKVKEGMRNMALVKTNTCQLNNYQGKATEFSLKTLVVYYNENEVPIEWRKADKYTRAQWECATFDNADDLVASLNQLDIKFQFTAKVQITYDSSTKKYVYWLLWSEYA